MFELALAIVLGIAFGLALLWAWLYDNMRKALEEMGVSKTRAELLAGIAATTLLSSLTDSRRRYWWEDYD
ncbi:MAG: hypothetical protein ABWK05_07110 [Pyrobaculum sp.]